MIPSRIEIANYRSFVDRASLKLKPLTLLFGRNNCGKSALLRLLPWVADSLGPDSQGPLDLTSSALRGASFTEILPQGSLSGRKELQLALEWEAPSARWQWTIRSDVDQGRPIEFVTDCRFFRGGREELSLNWRAPRAEQRLGTEFAVQVAGQAAIDTRVDFQGLVPSFSGDSSLKSTGCFDLLEGLKDSLQWLGSVRSLPARTVDPRIRRPRMDPSGQGVLELLVDDYFGRKEFFPAIYAFFEKALEQQLTIEARAESYAVMMGPLGQPTLRINLVDTGEGITQVLPVLVALARATLGKPGAPRLVAVEQPELHLHPSAQASLADYFCELAARPDPPILVVETHSENFLLSVQMAVLEGQLSRDHIAAYWVRRGPDGRSQLNELEFDDIGHPHGWPAGVFEERILQSRRIVAARQKRRLESK